MGKEENKLRVDEGRLVGDGLEWVMGIIEDTCYEEHWVLYLSNESLNFTPEADIALFVNQLEVK